MSLACCFRVLDEIRKTSSRNKKMRILVQWDSDEMRRLLLLFLDPYKVYGIRKFKLYATRDDVPTIDELENLCSRLDKRAVTGYAALGEVSAALSVKDEFLRSWLGKVITRDFRIGLSAGSVNKAFPDLIPSFDIGLCGVFEDTSVALPEGEWCIEPKLDGLRLITEVDEKGDCKFLSRSGKDLRNLERIEDEIKACGLRSVVLDGEAMAKDWNDTASILHTKAAHAKKSELFYNLFDVLDLEDWQAKQCTYGYRPRRARLHRMVERSDVLKVVDSQAVGGMESARLMLDKYLSLGYEGAVLKQAMSGYQYGRGGHWLKWKKTYTSDVEVIDVLEGGGRNAGRCGALKVLHKGVSVQVGSGLSDEQRIAWFKKPEDIIGQMIEVKYQEETKAGSLRFPVLVRVRVDREPGI